MSPKFRPIFRTLVLGSTAATGLTFLLLGGQLLLRAKGSASWPSVSGLVVTTEIENAPGSGSAQQLSTIYEYEVGGRTYTGDRFSFGEDPLPDRETAERRAAEFPAGTPVDVFHHPDKHGLSTLRPGAPAGLYRLPATGAALLLAGLPLAHLALRAAAPGHRPRADR